MKSPALSRIRQLDTHRLIPSKYRESGDSVLVRIADNDDHLRSIFELDLATDERLSAESDRLDVSPLQVSVRTRPMQPGQYASEAECREAYYKTPSTLLRFDITD